MSKEKQILQMFQDGYSQRRIASTLRVSRNTVAKVVNAASDQQLPKGTLESMDEAEIHHALFPEEALIPTLVTPDFPYIHKELLKSGVTLKLLWQEYVDTCRDSGKPPYGYSQYCKLYQDYVAQNNLTMHIQHKPGDKLMVDWAGTTLQLYDKVTGDSCKVYLFVATLPFSMYCYAQVQFAPHGGHWCVCQRPPGGAQRPPSLRYFDRLNNNNVMLRCPLHNSVG